MNDDVAPENQLATVSQEDMVSVLANSLYPGAKPESIALVLSYCRVNGLNPMLKPVHIVPTWVKSGRKKANGDDIYEKRDILMPGIADYRIKAARSGQYGGKSEPEFGPIKEMKIGSDRVLYPEWCKITIKRIVQGQERDFPAKEFWLENYATVSKDSTVPNSMWRKRPFAQLAKCTESQALRMAFPELSGGVTAEEMEGKDFIGQTIEHEPEGAGGVAPSSVVQRRGRAEPIVRTAARQEVTYPPPDPDEEPDPLAEKSGTKWLKNLKGMLADATSRAAVEKIGEHPSVDAARENFPPMIVEQIDEMFNDAMSRIVAAEFGEQDANPDSGDSPEGNP